MGKLKEIFQRDQAVQSHGNLLLVTVLDLASSFDRRIRQSPKARHQQRVRFFGQKTQETNKTVRRKLPHRSLVCLCFFLKPEARSIFHRAKRPILSFKTMPHLSYQQDSEDATISIHDMMGCQASASRRSASLQGALA